MTADLALTEVQNFIEHLIRTAHNIKSNEEKQGYPSSRDMFISEIPKSQKKHFQEVLLKSSLRQTWEIAFETYDLNWGTKDEDTYGKIFDLNVDKLKNILA